MIIFNYLLKGSLPKWKHSTSNNLILQIHKYIAHSHYVQKQNLQVYPYTKLLTDDEYSKYIFPTS